ncbi:phosphate uptake regulator PhoU [Candidatus Woesearchaeota archaeon]|nr:phosphate uptake regulator PhoU [Candidatus Woesearchaeota archaeon]
MVSRKLIKFGRNSFVISLPKNWITDHDLKKGDEVNIHFEGDKLVVDNNSEAQIQPRVKTIDLTVVNPLYLRKYIISAYIRNYNVIEIIDHDIEKHLDIIKDSTREMIALEIMEQSKKKVVIKDFLNMNDISIINIVRRMDVIIRSMIKDLDDAIRQRQAVDFAKRDEDVNRLFIVGHKILNKVMQHPSLASQVEIRFKDAINYFRVIEALESTADQIKRLARLLAETQYILFEDCKNTKNPCHKEFIVLLDEINKTYLNILNEFYKRKKTASFAALAKKSEMMKDIEALLEHRLACKQHPKGSQKFSAKISSILEKLQRYENYVTRIAKAVINWDS